MPLMPASPTLPILMPVIPRQRWSCHSCGNCCRTLVGHLFARERERIDSQGWAEVLGVKPYVRAGRGWALNKRPDGACVFLDGDNRCLIHNKFGEEAKPLACRIFPFSVRAVRGGWQASLRFDCPSAASSVGKPIGQYRVWLGDLAGQLDHDAPSRDDVAGLPSGGRATIDEIEMLITRFVRWITKDGVPLTSRLVGGARVTSELSAATLKKVRGRRLGELMDMMFRALPAESQSFPTASDSRQRAMLRQLAFAHAEHVSLAEMRAGPIGKLRKRWQQLQMARQFRAGVGPAPPLPGFSGGVTFEAIEGIEAAGDDDARRIEDLLCRYLCGRLRGRSVFGRGYYNWPIFGGLAALWLSVAVAGWLARYEAAAEGEATLTYDNAAHALAVVDRAATRLPSLGSVAERTRAAFLLREDGIARLVNDYRLSGLKS
jgi:lysine-N-methylase